METIYPYYVNITMAILLFVATVDVIYRLYFRIKEEARWERERELGKLKEEWRKKEIQWELRERELKKKE